MWPFVPKAIKLGKPITIQKVPAADVPRGRVGIDTSGGAQRAKAHAEAAMSIKVFRAKENRWYTLDEIREQEK
jgi:hypothetical protein